MYYDRRGLPITGEQWTALFRRLRRVALTDLGELGRVSTIWLGTDHGFGGGPPLIFETNGLRRPAGRNHGTLQHGN